MDTTRALLGSLSRQEMRYLRTILQALHGAENNKMLDLVNLIEKTPDISQETAAQKLYGDAKSKAFIMMKARLQERLHETILIHAGEAQDPTREQDPTSAETIALYKQLTLAMALHKRGHTTLARQTLHEIAKNPLVPYNSSLRLVLLEMMVTLSTNLEELNLLTGDMRETIQDLEVDSLGAGFSRSYTHQTRLTTQSFELTVERTKSMIEELEQKITQRYSHKGYSFLLSLKADYYSITDQYQLCQQILNQISELYDRFPDWFDNTRRGALLEKKSRLNILTLNFNIAIQLGEEGLRFTSSRVSNLLTNLVNLSYANFYTADFESALVYIRQGKNLKKGNYDTVLILVYIELCIEYIQEGARKALKNFNVLDDLMVNKNQWNTSIRILELIFIIDLGYFDLASNKIESLRKHIAKYQIEGREQSIYRILKTLENNAFNFTKLESFVIEDKWISYSFEAIRFDSWLKSKIYTVPYWEQFSLDLDITRASFLP